MRGATRQEVGWQGRADNDATHGGVARRLSLAFSLSVGMRKARDGIRELRFINFAKGG